MGQRHPAVDGQVLGQRRSGREVVHVPVVAVVVGEPRRHLDACQQVVDEAGGVRVGVRTEHRSDQRPQPAYRLEVGRRQPADLAHRVPSHEVAEGVQVRQTLGIGAGGSGVDQIDGARQGVLRVVAEQHRAPLRRRTSTPRASA